MIQRERHLQYLIALAVAGQISDIEMEELRNHTANCSSCSQRMAEMESANLQLFLTLAAQGKKLRISSKMKERFLIRAAHSGVPMAASSSGVRRLTSLHLAALFVTVCLFFGLGWRHIAQVSVESIGSSSPMKIATRSQLSASTGPNSATLEVPAAQRSIRRRRNRHAPGDAGSLPSFAPVEESRVVPEPLFRLHPGFSASQPRAFSSEAALSTLQYLPAKDFSPRANDLAPGFSAPTIVNSSMGSNPNQRVFHYSQTLASVSLQDDQVIFGLKLRGRDLSFSSTLDSNRPR